MEVLDTSKQTKEESIEILKKELSEHPFLYLTGPQGGGKTSLSIMMADENVGAIYEGRARAAQPVIMIRRDLLDRMEQEIVERRKLPIFEGDEPIYVDVTMLDKLNYIIELVFDLMELGEEKLYTDMEQLVALIGVVPRHLEVIADEDILVRRRLERHMDASRRLEELLRKEKQYGIKSNMLGIQGAKVMDIIGREGVGKYEEGQFSRTVEDFDRLISTKDMTLGQCLLEIVEISNEENKESGFLMLHSKDGTQKIISDLVVGKQENSMIGVTLLEVYVGYRQNRSMYQTYKGCLDGRVEVIHSFTPKLQEAVGLKQMMGMNLDYFTQEDKAIAAGLLSEADIAAAERFGITVTVVDTDGKIESSDPERVKKLDRFMYEAFQEFKANEGQDK
ncbi:MAG: hypothetical protein C5S43_03985 [Candidatus Methanocomedens sp.]|nr:MAG: hypothetical protein C5S43_03985 [ANME-2 cluster archaeon]